MIVGIVDKEMWRRGLVAAGFNGDVFKVGFIISTFVEYREHFNLYGVAVCPMDTLAELMGESKEKVEVWTKALGQYGWLEKVIKSYGDGIVTGYVLKHGKADRASTPEALRKYDYKGVVRWNG